MLLMEKWWPCYWKKKIEKDIMLIMILKIRWWSRDIYIVIQVVLLTLSRLDLLIMKATLKT